MQFSKIWRGVNNLKNPKNNQNKKISKKSAFSLIELSIVLIIIGLLVAGVTGGASLIESAKVRSLINEMRGWNQAFYTFMSIKGRLPGDLNNSGRIGAYSGQTYDANSFRAPYNDNNNEYGIPIDYIAPFVDMYLEGVIDFKPTYTNTGLGKYYHYLKQLDDYRLFFEFYNPSTNLNNYLYNIPENSTYITGWSDSSNRRKIDSIKIIKSFDEKIDDGKFNGGIVRSECIGSSNKNDYEDVINYSSGICGRFIYKFI